TDGPLRVTGEPKYSICDDSMALGLDPSLISGASGADFHEVKDGSGMFWRLEAPARERWEAKAAVHNRKAQRFLDDVPGPNSVSLTSPSSFLDIVLDAVSHVRLPSTNNTMWQDQVNANMLAGLFPHLRKFTPAQNTALLDLFTNRVWAARGAFRLETGTGILFAHGKPTTDLIDQLIGRCLSWTRPYSKLDRLLELVALLIQKHWPDVAGTRILDLALVMLSPGHPGPAGGRTVPGDKIFEISGTSPAACKHLLPVTMMICRAGMIRDPASKVLGLFEAFGVAIRGRRTEVLPWLLMKYLGDDANTTRLQRLLTGETGGKPACFGIEAKDCSPAELMELNRAAMERLGNLTIL
ncbi:hypothetical protein DFH09DRAFT_1155624, partial [Mycena vulgaris]